MTDLCPLNLPVGVKELETIGEFTLAVTTRRQVVSISCAARGRKDLSRWLEAECGLRLPEPGRLSSRDGATIVSSALDQWFLELDSHPAVDHGARIALALAGVAAVTEQSGGWVRFAMAGPRLDELFQRLCPLDTGAMKADHVARTKIHHIGCLVWRENQGFVVMGPRSTTLSLRHALADAALSVSGAQH